LTKEAIKSIIYTDRIKEERQMKYEVWYENWYGTELDKVFNTREEAEAYLEKEERMLFSDEENMYIIEVEE
jgi:hypothetical protein